MFDHYEYFKIDYGASHEEVRAALDLAYQDLKRQGGTDEQYKALREAQETLLNPMNRVEYDKKLGVKFPEPVVSSEVKPPDRRGIVALICLCAALVLVLVFFIPGKLKSASKPAITPGVYLVSPDTGENEAVLRKFEAKHPFPDGSEKEGYEILHLKSNEIDWISKGELVEKYKAGGFAPRSLTGN